MKKPKISFFLSHPIQYYTPLFKELAKHSELTVYYFSDISAKEIFDEGFGKKITWDIPLLDGYPYRLIKNWSWSNRLSNKFFQLINPGVIYYLFKDSSPVIIIASWSYFSDLLTIITAKVLGKKVWLRAENPLNQELRKSSTNVFMKRIILKNLLFKLIDRFLYIGLESKDFFLFYNIKAEQLIYTPYSVDNNFFRNKYELLKDQKTHLLQKNNLPTDKKIILYCGKYIAQKKPLDLLNAFLTIKTPNCALIMVGDGPLRPEMELFIKKNNISNIVLTGFINQSLISEYYSIADVFVMCSGMGETWGLSINEAMNFSLPIVVSSTCGSSRNLVNNNGAVFAEGNTEQLCNAIDVILGDHLLQKKAGEKSATIVQQFTNQIVVKNLLEAYAQ